MSIAPSIRRVMGEPLVHFLLIGFVLFAIYEAAGGDSGPESARIAIDNAQVERLAERHRLIWQRDPSPDQVRALVEAHVRDEIFFREGLAAGLGDDDEIIRRRVRQKLEVLAEESGRDNGTDEAELRAYFEANTARYAEPASITFEQVFFDGARGGPEAAKQAAREAMSAIAAGAALPPGDTSLLPRNAQNRNLTQIEATFGKTFAGALEIMPVGQWQGPVLSPFGAHIVRVKKSTPGRVPKMSAVRAQVERDWEGERRKKALDVYYRSVRKNYEIDFADDVPAGLRPRG